MRSISQAGSPYRIERLSTLEQLDALGNEWSDLLEEIPAAPIFLTWEWIRTWWLFFGEGRELWLLTARAEQGRLLGIAPFMKEEYRKGPVKLGMLTFIGSGRVCPTHLNILAHSADREGVYRAFLQFLLGQPAGWDVLRISSVYADSPDCKLLAAAGGRLRVGGQTTLLYMPLPGSWDAFLNMVGRDHRYNLRSSLAKLEAAYPGMVEFTCVKDPCLLDAAMEKLVDLIRERCHARNIPTSWDDPTFTSFQRAIVSIALERDWLLMHTLLVNGQMIGVLCNFHFRDRVYAYSVGFDRAWKRYGPGHLIIGFGVQNAIQCSAQEIEMGRADSAYKMDWTDHVRVEDEVLFGHSWSGSLWIAVGNLERGIRMRLAGKQKKQPSSPRPVIVED